MAGFEVWNAVKVRFPYTDHSVQQFRPALVVARLGDGASPALLWLLMITSANQDRAQVGRHLAATLKAASTEN